MGDSYTASFQMQRAQIAQFAKEPKTIRDIEQLGYLLNTTVPNLFGTKVDETRLLIAGDGLTGGGDLSGDITFDVGQGTGMIINADDIAIDLVAEAERIRDVIGAALTDTATIDFTANDAGDTITADLKNTTVTPGSYTSANITVDAQGRLTAAANGSIAAGSVGTTQLADGSVTLAKQANVASGTVFYRKTAGSGPPETQTLATLKADLGLTGISTGGSLRFAVKTSGNYLPSDTQSFTTTTVSAGTGTISFFPFSKGCTINALAIEVTTAAAGGNTARAALYTANATTGLPDVLIEEATAQSIASTGTKVFPFASSRVISDLVWMAVQLSATATVRNANTADSAIQLLGSSTISTSSINNRITASFTFGAFPADTSLLTLGASQGGIALAARIA